MNTDGRETALAPRRRFHTTSVWWMFACFCGFLGVLAGGAALNPGVPLVGRALCAAVAVGLVITLILGWRAGVEVNEDTVTVRTYRGTSREVPWKDVVRFEMVSNGNGGVYIAVVDHDGRRLTTQGLSAARPTSVGAQRTIAELEALRPDSEQTAT